jgi:hypothetical protein
MKKQSLFLFLILVSSSIFTQTYNKPIGCFAGTNGTASSVLSHPSARGVLLIEKWSNIELTPGIYDFTSLNAKINTVKNAGLQYALAISGGAFGSPDWLIDSLNVAFHNFQYQNMSWRLPLWWDTTCEQKINELIDQLGNQYASDTMLSHVYVTQMTVNGIEGHLNGVNMALFEAEGFTNQKWIEAAKNTTYRFANAFPDKPIVFEIHEINQDTIVPATIINDLTDAPDLCNRLGLGMWWISGKTSYQTDLIDFIYHYQGDKYAQVIGRSDQEERFQDSSYSTVFEQAKHLNIRYIEPWPYEFQHYTHDDLLNDFNTWADSNFQPTDSCLLINTNYDRAPKSREVIIYPNPAKELLYIQINFPYETIETRLYDASGKYLLSAANQTAIDISEYPNGMYFLEISVGNSVIYKKLIKTD